MKGSHWIARIAPAALAAALLTACGHGPATGSAVVIDLPAGGPVAETVNGTPVSESLLDAVARGRGLDVKNPEQRAKVLKEVTDYVLLSQAAVKGGFSADSGYAATVEASRLLGVANATMAKFQSEANVDDSVLKTEYDQQVRRAGKYAYDFSQMVFADEGEALKAEADLVAGKPFSDVFDAWKDKAQARAFNGVRASQVPEELAQTLASLQPGESTRVPVKTGFGWHVVYLAKREPFTPPAFDKVKEGIRATLLARFADERLAALRKDAKIVMPAAAAPAQAPAKDGAVADAH